MAFDASAIRKRILPRLARLYPDAAEGMVERIESLVRKYVAAPPPARTWSEQDVVLIAYGDQVHDRDRPTLEVLRNWIVAEQWDRFVSTVHLLPIHPYSSDDGFSVVDFRRVDSALGDWEAIHRLGEHVDLMLDLVLNHVSRQSDWFSRYLAGEPPYDRYFIEVDPQTDLSAVVRPRSLPLLTPVETLRGRRHVWTTFSDDQIDLNYREPHVLLEMIDVFLSLIGHGARILRLDAVAFLWKQVGTPCIHLPETHEVVKLLRDLVDTAAPHVLLLTETNVPHQENLSYLGNGDEAHMVYQFSLPPLLLDAVLSGSAGRLRKWLAELPPPPSGTTFLNFTASHDGIGLRPLEGLAPPEQIDRLAEAARQRGGRVSTRRGPDGADAPYELNITYVDAVGDPGIATDLHARRFLTTQAVMLALQGMPAVYFNSLAGCRNDVKAAVESGQNRRINRTKHDFTALQARLAAEEGLAPRIYRGYRRLLELRRRQPAFHPDGSQHVLDLGAGAILAFERCCPAGAQRIVSISHFGAYPAEVALPAGRCRGRDLISGAFVNRSAVLAPYQTMWLELT